MEITTYEVASRFIGMREVPGTASNPQILAMLQLDGSWPKDDAVPWCSAFVNFICWLLGLHRSKSLRARSWLWVGSPIGSIEEAKQGDIVILKRGSGYQPGPDVLKAPGHVGFFSSYEGGDIFSLLGGNQSDTISIARYNISRILGVRRVERGY